MEDFYEQFVSVEQKKIYIIGNIFIGIGALGFFFFLANSQFIGEIVFLLFIVAMVIVKRYRYLDFEYNFTNGEVDIDKIIGRAKRKRIVTFDVKEVEIFALSNSEHMVNYEKNKSVKEYNLYPSTTTDKVYSVVVNIKGSKCRINFVPDEKFIELCYRKNPRVVKKY